MARTPYPGFLIGGNQHLLGDTVPTRVLVAMEFLAYLTAKQQVRAVVNSVSIELIKGQALTTSESNAQASACNLLNDYFLGKVKPSHQERLQRDVVDSIIAPDGVLNTGRVIKCFACGFDQPPRDGCLFCNGTGTLLTYPITNQGE